MSKNTFFNTRFWQDSYIANLDPSEKLLFVYCITAPFLSLSGIYEVPLKFIANETGIDKDMVEKMLARFERDKKIAYKDGWICVFKYPKYQSYNLPNVKKGLEKELSTIPVDILNYFVDKGYSYDAIANALPSDCQYGTGIGNKEQGTRKGKEEKPEKKTYGEFKNVHLTDEEYQKLVEALNQNAVEGLIEQLSGYMESKGKRYKSHYATIQVWARRRIDDHVKEIKSKKSTVAF